MRETAVQFGELGRLNGIVSEPSEPCNPSIGFIIITAGLTTKAGPFRLYTELAREVVKTGFTALRFDLGGICNSEEIHPSLPLKKRTEKDIEQATMLLQDKYGITNYILGGLCSGAEDSFRYAKRDERVMGVFMIDGHAYRTKMWWIKHTLNIRFVIHLAGNMLRFINSFKYATKNDTQLDGESTLIDYQQMQFEESFDILKSLVVRNTKLLYIYTLGMSDKFNHSSQFFSMYPKLNSTKMITIKYLPEMSHIQIFEQDRRKMVNLIKEWLATNFDYSHAEPVS